MSNTSYISNAKIETENSFFLSGNSGIESHASAENNWAFIDMQNLYQGVKKEGWKLDWFLFRQFLLKEYQITMAIGFMGYIKKNEWLYDQIRNAGFLILFREVKELYDGEIDGGNCDADLAGAIMDYKNEYNQSIIIADDADYCLTIKSLLRQNKLKLVISSNNIQKTSRMVKAEVAPRLLFSIHNLKNLIQCKTSLRTYQKEKMNTNEC